MVETIDDAAQIHTFVEAMIGANGDRFPASRDSAANEIANRLRSLGQTLGSNLAFATDREALVRFDAGFFRRLGPPVAATIAAAGQDAAAAPSASAQTVDGITQSAQAAREGLDALANDIRGASEDNGRSLLPGVAEQYIGRFGGRWEHASRVVRFANVAYEVQRAGRHFITLAESFDTFHRAFSNPGAATGAEIRAAGGSMVAAGNAIAEVIGDLPIPDVFKIHLQFMIRSAVTFGGVGTGIFANHFDRLSLVAQHGQQQRGRGMGGTAVDTDLQEQLQRQLGGLFIGEVSSSAAVAAAQRRVIGDADGFVASMRAQAGHLSDPDVRLRHLGAMTGLLHAASARLQGDLTGINQLLLLIRRAWNRFGSFDGRDSILGVLNSPGSDAAITSIVLNYGRVAGVAEPSDVGL